MDGTAILSGLNQEYLTWGTVLALLTAFELLNPHESHKVRDRLIGVLFWTVFIALSFFLAMLLSAASQTMGLKPIFTVPALQDMVGGPLMATIVGALLAAVIHDFFFYWYHRIQHRWLWRWHSVHHSIEDLNAVNSYHHPTEPIMSLLLLQLPMAALVGVDRTGSSVIGFFLFCHVVWIHSPTKLTLGPLRAILVDNRFHRIHHSAETRHFDANFGAFTTIWDRMFGTCHMPERGEWPRVGIAEARQPRSLGDWVRQPWRV